MKKSFRSLALLLTLLMIATMGLAACGSKSEESADDGQNPAMNFVGNYSCDRANIVIGADGESGMNAVVTWGSSAWENSSWTMSGTFDPETLQFEYHDCVKTNYVYSEDGEVESKEEVFTGGHGFMKFTDGDLLSLTWQEDQEHVADGMVFEFSAPVPEEGEVGMPNPWSDVDSAAAAAEGAGIGTFEVPEGAEISLGAVKVDAYRCMDGLAEVKVEYPAVEMTIRKGEESAADVGKGDISGDYGEYSKTWKQDIDGTEVTCFGNREGEATKTIWQNGDYFYSITAIGLGGDEDYGLSADDLSILVSGTK